MRSRKVLPKSSTGVKSGSIVRPLLLLKLAAAMSGNQPITPAPAHARVPLAGMRWETQHSCRVRA